MEANMKKREIRTLGLDESSSGSLVYLSFVCIVSALGGLLFGFDTVVISGTVGLVTQQFQMNSGTVGLFVSSALIGCVIGAAIAGTVSDRFGRKKVLVLSSIFFLVSAYGCGIAASSSFLIWARWIGGVGVGMASMVCPLYISEISPSKVRGRMVTLFQFAITIGICLALFSNAWLREASFTQDKRDLTDLSSMSSKAANITPAQTQGIAEIYSNSKAVGVEHEALRNVFLDNLQASVNLNHKSLQKYILSEGEKDQRKIIISEFSNAIETLYNNYLEKVGSLEPEMKSLWFSSVELAVVSKVLLLEVSVKPVDKATEQARAILSALIANNKDALAKIGSKTKLNPGDYREIHEKGQQTISALTERNISMTKKRSNFNWMVVDEVWRSMFAFEVLPALAFFILCFVIPESPRWLIKAGQLKRAQGILTKIGGIKTASQQMDEINDAIAHEGGSIMQLFKPGLRKALFIALFLAVVSEFSGVTVILYYGPGILERAGFTLGDALGGFASIGIVNVVFTVIALWLIDKVGRRPLLFIGNIGCLIALATIGVLFTIGRTEGLIIVFMLCLFMACFAFSMGPIKWVVMSEIFPTRIRGRAIAIATLAVWFADALYNQLFPMVKLHIGVNGSFFIFAIVLIPQIFFVWFVMPETKNRTLEEIESSWTKK